MNNDLISRSALLGSLDKLYMAALRKTENSVETIYELDHLSMLVKDAPAVDAVEVVRCKDCVWYQPKWLNGVDVCGKIMHNALRVSPNFFCQRGEREEDNNGKDN